MPFSTISILVISFSVSLISVWEVIFSAWVALLSMTFTPSLTSNLVVDIKKTINRKEISPVEVVGILAVVFLLRGIFTMHPL